MIMCKEELSYEGESRRSWGIQGGALQSAWHTPEAFREEMDYGNDRDRVLLLIKAK